MEIQKNNSDDINKAEYIGKKISAFREKNIKKENHINQNTVHIFFDLIAAIGVGFTLGWYLDSTFGSQPIGIILCTIFGFLAAIKKLAN